jgi:hypothetical protein
MKHRFSETLINELECKVVLKLDTVCTTEFRLPPHEFETDDLDGKFDELRRLVSHQWCISKSWEKHFPKGYLD